MTPACVPEWNIQGLSCPFGEAGGLPLAPWTWPSPDHRTLLTYIAVFYSSFPFVILAITLAILLLRRGTRELSTLCFFALTDAVTLVLKLCFEIPRPVGSCLLSCGMPSGHSVIAIGFLTWLLLEVWKTKYVEGGNHSFLLSALLCLLLLPVTWSRVELLDHSISQVCAGSAIGVVLGMFWFGVMQSRTAWWLCQSLTTALPLLQMNYNHPAEHTAESKTFASNQVPSYDSTSEPADRAVR